MVLSPPPIRPGKSGISIAEYKMNPFKTPSRTPSESPPSDSQQKYHQYYHPFPTLGDLASVTAPDTRNIDVISPAPSSTTHDSDELNMNMNGRRRHHHRHKSHDEDKEGLLKKRPSFFFSSSRKSRQQRAKYKASKATLKEKKKSESKKPAKPAKPPKQKTSRKASSTSSTSNTNSNLPKKKHKSSTTLSDTLLFPLIAIGLATPGVSHAICYIGSRILASRMRRESDEMLIPPINDDGTPLSTQQKKERVEEIKARRRIIDEEERHEKRKWERERKLRKKYVKLMGKDERRRSMEGYMAWREGMDDVVEDVDGGSGGSGSGGSSGSGGKGKDEGKGIAKGRLKGKKSLWRFWDEEKQTGESSEAEREGDAKHEDLIDREGWVAGSPRTQGMFANRSYRQGSKKNGGRVKINTK